MAEVLHHVNATLNAISGVLLFTGLGFVRAGNIEAHKRCMSSAFACSVLFLISYLTRYALTGEHRYPGEGWDRTLYLCVLASHVALAALVPFLALRTLYLGLRRRDASHRKWARITFPIWAYVSITGIVVYWMLYHYAGVPA